MIQPKLTDEMVIAGEIEALENAINNPSDRADYLCDFWSNADLLLRTLKFSLKGEVNREQRVSKAS